MSKIKWTNQQLAEIALQYETRNAFQKQRKTIYNIAHRRGIMGDICSHMKTTNTRAENNPNFKWTTKVLEVEALKYSSRSEFKINNPKAYAAAWRNKILDIICSHMRSAKNERWTDEELIKEASKYRNRKEFEENNSGALQVAQRRAVWNSIATKLELLKTPTYTLEDISSIALKYKTRSQFQKCDSGAYQSAIRKNIIDKVCSHMESNKWTNRELAIEALKYKTRGEFSKNNNGAYSTAQQRGLLDEICRHAPKIKGTSMAQKDMVEFVRRFYPEALEDSHIITHPLELDIYIPELKLGIEYCGLYWHSEKYRKDKITILIKWSPATKKEFD